MSNTIYIKFKSYLGEIPRNSIGFFLNRNFCRVFLLRSCVKLENDSIPCYDTPFPTEQDGKLSSEYYEQIQQDDLASKELQELLDLEKEIQDKTNIYIGPDGIIIAALGDPKYIKQIIKEHPDQFPDFMK
jgi:hypothetical protein